MAQANILLLDGAATPVNRTFTPQGTSPELARWLDTSGGISIGMPEFTFTVKLGATPAQSNRVSGKLSIPVLETISGADSSGYAAVPSLALTGIGKFELVLPQRMTAQQRKDLRAMLYDALGDAIVTSAITTFERP